MASSGYLEFRVYLSAAFNGEANEWFNRFVYRTPYDADAPQARALAGQLLSSVRAFTLAYAKIERCAIYDFEHIIENKEDQSPNVFSADRNLEAVAREVRNPCPKWVALQLDKQHTNGRLAHSWFFHSLNQDEVAVGNDGQLILTNVEAWEHELQFWWRDAFIPHSDFQLVTTPRGGLSGGGGGIRDASWLLGYPVLARARDKMRAKTTPKLVEIQQLAADAADYIEDSGEQLQIWIDQELDFQPLASKDIINQCLAYTQSVCTHLKTYYDKMQDSSNTAYPIPLNRWGVGFDALAFRAVSILPEFEIDQDTIAQIVPYTAYGSEYYKNADVFHFLLLLQKYMNWVAGFLDFDYLTPYTGTATGDVTPE